MSQMSSSMVIRTDSPMHSETALPRLSARPRRIEGLIQPPALRPYRGWEYLLNVIAPPQCALCDTAVDGIAHTICDACERKAIWKCSASSFGPVYSCFRHETLSRRAISRFKFHGERWRGLALGQHLALHWLASNEGHIDAQDLLIPIPLTKQRLRTRGFNQATVIIRGVQQRLRLEASLNTLLRVEGGQRDQKSLNREARLHSANPFTARAHHAGRRVWLVDDVITTGATLQHAANALLHAGLVPVGALTLNWTMG